MTLCTALFKTGKNCTYKAKYILKEYNEYYCKKHALMHSNLKMKTSYNSIDDVDGLNPIGYQPSVVNNINDILIDIYNNHQLKFILVSEIKEKYYYTGGSASDIFNEFIVVNKDNDTQKYILKITKSASAIDNAMDISSSYANILPSITKPICVPIISYKTTMNPKSYKNNQICLLRGWKYNNWYYELISLSYPLLELDNDQNRIKKLIKSLFNLIELSHESRIVHGSIELRNLVQLKEKNISSIVFKSLANALFWQGRYGQTIDEDTEIDSNITFDSLYCSRNLNQKKYPCRYDDYESLLYLIMILLNHDLPWIGLTSSIDIVNEKTNFLITLSKSNSIGSEIANMILNSHYDDKPNYNKLNELFTMIN